MKIINDLVVKSLKENKTRTTTTIIGTTLAFTLMFLIALGVGSIRFNILKQIINTNGSYHYVILNAKNTQSELITENNDIESYTIITEELINTDESENYMLTSYNLDYEEDITLYNGNYPKNTSEIIISRALFEDGKIKVGDYINSYKVVGVYNKSNYTKFAYENRSYTTGKDRYLITSFEEKEYSSYSINYKKVVGSYKKINALARSLGFQRDITSKGTVIYENIKYNSDLLELYGEYARSGAGAMLKLLLIIVLSVISLVTFFILINSFSISVKERSKQFGILSSIGTTRKQIFIMVLLEGFYIGFISMVISFLLSILLIMLLLGITNYLLTNIISDKFLINMYWPYILTALGYGIITLFLAVLSPARRVSLTSPIESIQDNLSFNSKKRKFRKNSRIAKLFKIEGILASKNTRRNASKYKVIIITISISILLYLFSSACINLYTNSMDFSINAEKYGFSVTGIPEEQAYLFNNIENVDEMLVLKSTLVSFKKPDENLYYSYSKERLNYEVERMFVYEVTKEQFEVYINKYDLDDKYPIIVNTNNIYDEEFNVISTEPIFKENANFPLSFCNYETTSDTINKSFTTTINDCYFSFDSVNLINDNNIKLGNNESLGYIITTKNMFEEILKDCTNDLCMKYKENPTVSIYINASNKIHELDEIIQDIVNTIDKEDNSEIYYNNSAIYFQDAKMIVFVLKIFIYFILSFIILICFTFMINTIASSLMLRKTEFAVLKSIGMTNKSVKRMVFLESIGVGIKSLVTGIILAYMSIYLFYASINTNTNEPVKYDYPIKETLYMFIVIVIFNAIIYMYMMNRINKDNIIDDIRNSNI